MGSKLSKRDVEDVRDEFHGRLRDVGICDKVTLKAKSFARPGQRNWIGLYRGLSQFRSRPIFWVNENIPKQMEEEDVGEEKLGEVLVDTFLHEYGHVIAEWGMKRNKELNLKVQACFMSDEDFAESFARYSNGKTVSWSKRACMDDIVGMYLKDLPDIRC